VPQSSPSALVMRRWPGADPGDGHRGAEQARRRVDEERVLDAADQAGHRGAGRRPSMSARRPPVTMTTPNTTA
jgi:hypothetical protein